MLSPQCQAILESGEPCGGYAITGSQFCFMHDPDKAPQRAEAQSKGGRARQDRTLALDPERRQARVVEFLDNGLKEGRKALLGVIADVEALENSVARARTIGYLLSLYANLDEMIKKQDIYDGMDDDDDWSFLSKGASSDKAEG